MLYVYIRPWCIPVSTRRCLDVVTTSKRRPNKVVSMSCAYWERVIKKDSPGYADLKVQNGRMESELPLEVDLEERLLEG